MKGRSLTTRQWISVIVIAILLMGFPLSWVECWSARVWLYPGSPIGIDRDDYAIIRCGSGAQNLFWIPVEPLLACSIFIPAMWVVVVLISDARGARLRAHARELRWRQICTACGYDLRATPDRCPECGTVVVNI